MNEAEQIPEQEVTWPLDRAIATVLPRKPGDSVLLSSVWETLQRRGVESLPALDSVGAAMAIHEARQYMLTEYGVAYGRRGERLTVLHPEEQVHDAAAKARQGARKIDRAYITASAVNDAALLDAARARRARLLDHLARQGAKPSLGDGKKKN